MRPSRLAPIAAAGALLAASFTPAAAQTAEPVPGTSTTVGELTVLGITAGDLLSVRLLSDAGAANTDENVGAPAALAQLQALDIASPALGVSESIPLVQASSTGGTDEESQAVTPIDNPVVSGSLLPTLLSALVGQDRAASTVTSGLADLDVLGGVLRVAAIDLGLGADAADDQASVLRDVDIDALAVLDLETLLAGLGIPLTSLPLDTVLDLVDGLGLLPQLGGLLQDLGVPVDLTDLSVDGILGTVSGLTGDIVVLESLTDDLTAAVPVCDLADPALDLLGGLLGGGGGDVLCDDVVQTATDAVEAVLALTDQLGAALDAPLDLLAGTSLLSLDGLDVTVVTTATDDVATSVADVDGTLGTLTVGELSLGSLDLTGTADQLGAVLAQATGAIGNVLGQIDPRLADLVQIQTLEETTSIVEDAAGNVVSSAGFTGLRIDVLPDLDELLSIIQGLGSVESVGDLLAGAGLPLPAGATEILDLGSLLEGVPTSGLAGADGVLALTEGLTVEVASLSQSATFVPGVAAPGAPTPAPTPTPAPAPTPVPSLPRTGTDGTLVLLLGAGAAVAALGARRLSQRS